MQDKYGKKLRVGSIIESPYGLKAVCFDIVDGKAICEFIKGTESDIFVLSENDFLNSAWIITSSYPVKNTQYAVYKGLQSVSSRDFEFDERMN